MEVPPAGAAMNARDQVLGAIRRSLGVSGNEAPRRREVADRLAGHPRGVVPARGQGAPQERLDLFARMVEGAAGSIARVNDAADVPEEVAAFLRRYNLRWRPAAAPTRGSPASRGSGPRHWRSRPVRLIRKCCPRSRTPSRASPRPARL